MDMVWFAASGSVLTIAFFARELLIEHKSRKIIFAVTLAMFVTAMLLPLFTRDKLILYPSLMNPLVSLGLFLLMHKLFVRWTNRDPVDTFMDWTKGLGPDRWFNILYFTFGIFLMFLLYMAAGQTGHKWH